MPHCQSRSIGGSLQHFTRKEGLPFDNVYGMLEDRAGRIWFASSNAGACRYDGETFTSFSETDSPKK